MIKTTLSLPPHQEKGFKEILAGISHTQKRIGVHKWNRVLGGLCSMAISLPRARGLFIHIQEALCHVEGNRVVLTRGVHQALTDFQWLADDLGKRSTRLYEIVPLQPTLGGYHEASRYMCKGAVLTVSMEVPRTPQPHPRAAATSRSPQ